MQSCQGSLICTSWGSRGTGRCSWGRWGAAQFQRHLLSPLRPKNEIHTMQALTYLRYRINRQRLSSSLSTLRHLANFKASMAAGMFQCGRSCIMQGVGNVVLDDNDSRVRLPLPALPCASETQSGHGTMALCFRGWLVLLNVMILQ